MKTISENFIPYNSISITVLNSTTIEMENKSVVAGLGLGGGSDYQGVARGSFFVVME